MLALARRNEDYVYLEAAKKRFMELDIAETFELIPCTEQEVKALEERLNLTLPKAYQEFLLWAGHGAGHFLRGSDCFYKDTLKIQNWAEELLNENHFPKQLPKDAFVFFMHQGYQFNFFRMRDGDDPPVYFYIEGSEANDFITIYPNFSQFLITEMEAYVKL